jgi:hypothetical protein
MAVEVGQAVSTLMVGAVNLTRVALEVGEVTPTSVTSK